MKSGTVKRLGALNIIAHAQLAEIP